MNDLVSIPVSWEWTTLADIGKLYSGGTPKTTEPSNFDGEIAWITPADLTGYTAKTIENGRRNITQRGLESSSATLMPAKTVMFSSRAPIGYVAIASNEIATNQGFKNIFVGDNIDENYVYHYLKGAKQLAEQHASGTTFKEISGARFAKLPIPLAPLNEQQRIVEKIETLFARLDKGEEAVRDVQKLLTRYRQSVLKSAVTGQLTADWRAERKGQLEHGRDLLERILEKRRKTWDGRGKYKEPADVDQSTLSASPEGWVWSTSGQLCDCIVPNRDKPKSFTGDVPWINIPDLADTGLFIGSSKEGIGLSDTEIEIARARVIPASSVIMSCVGRFGIAAVCERDLVINQQLHAFLVPEGLLAPEFLALSLQAQKKFMEDTSTATTIAYLNKSKCNSVPIPVPSFAEQQEIVNLTMQAFENADVVEELCKTELKRSASLRQSILKDAFTGKLVPQDPTDEPASALLARIAAEKPTAKKTRRKTSA